jgi:hypothetical protein
VLGKPSENGCVQNTTSASELASRRSVFMPRALIDNMIILVLGAYSHDYVNRHGVVIPPSSFVSPQPVRSR